MKKGLSQDIGLVLKNSDGLYYYGLNQFGNQIRRSKIYHSEKYATDACKTINSDERTKRIKQDFKLVKVEIKEV